MHVGKTDDAYCVCVSPQGDPEKPVDANIAKWAKEFGADVPTDLASLYAKKGGVDLSILSELTQSVGASGEEDYPSRSKRTCVRVREQITKLQEILGDEAETRSPGSTGSKVKGRGTGRVPANRSSDVGQQESSGGGGVSPKKYKRPTYSQFTHKRRKRKKKSPEEGTYMCSSVEYMCSGRFQNEKLHSVQ